MIPLKNPTSNIAVGIPDEGMSARSTPINSTTSLPGGRLGKANVKSIVIKKATKKIMPPAAFISSPLSFGFSDSYPKSYFLINVVNNLNNKDTRPKRLRWVKLS